VHNIWDAISMALGLIALVGVIALFLKRRKRHDR
jgi:LPXTG-motif cell wall-anchored protein